MRDDPLYGRVAPELGWVPPPRYLLRRHRVLELLKDLPRGPLLEVGCGAGALLSDLDRLSFEATALETSAGAAAVAQQMLSDSPGVRIHREPSPAWAGQFDYVLAFEVLEHIEDDRAALNRWQQWLSPGGRLILSVPAHQDRWGANDVWAGHYRRYDRDDLVEKVRSAGLVVERLEWYGVPLANILHPIRNAVREREMARSEAKSLAKRTAASGIDRSTETKLFPLQDSLPGRAAMRFFMQLQKLFLRREWGNGVLLVARKVAA